MSEVNCSVETKVSRSSRARQVEALFDVPMQEIARLSWQGSVPLDARTWSVGLIVGPSGSGKTTVARALFGDAFHPEVAWSAASVVDDVRADVPVARIAEAFSSVGFGTVPAWLRPYAVLSNGERFRADMARRLLELPDPIVVDEFTSVVDRQVAQVGAHAVQKMIRKEGRRFVAVTCHHDVVDWLQPDWVLEPSSMSFRWRSVQPRPRLEIEMARVPYEVWQLFAPYHYLTAELHKAAQCFAAFVDAMPVSFAAILHMPHPTVRDIKRCSRLVTLPDWQGLGLAFVLIDAVGAAYRATGYRARTYPAHPALVRAFDRSPRWALRKQPGTYQSGSPSANPSTSRLVKTRPCATFEYVGPAHPDRSEAERFLAGT